ncbi:GNAT family N-acetyltransferase [Saccharopolyspora sp. K220]|uniref:GNAT family N-acetyltransferase n=1 Tax=Saccharopolyspora soli TaxID=2926618 RepID=UPI001F5749FE|nr:GNAT family N-acetyltransferase [Saccharopolyspora soli]MCI2420346.1 GNAT family N-acetyltransferase [Saccharopolyspora soli]
MAEADVRVAVPSDAAEIARIQLTTWRTAYTELLPPAVLEGLDSAETEQQWHQTLTSGPAAVLVATEGPWIVGFCAAGPAPEAEMAAADGAVPPDAPEVALVSALLVEPRWGRRGHGGRLLGAMARRLVADGATRGITWVPEADTASMAFFRSAGWAPDGTVRTLDAGGRPLRELRLSGPLELQFEN